MEYDWQEITDQSKNCAYDRKILFIRAMVSDFCGFRYDRTRQRGLTKKVKNRDCITISELNVIFHLETNLQYAGQQKKYFVKNLIQIVFNYF